MYASRDARPLCAGVLHGRDLRISGWGGPRRLKRELNVVVRVEAAEWDVFFVQLFSFWRTKMQSLTALDRAPHPPKISSAIFSLRGGGGLVVRSKSGALIIHHTQLG